MLPLVAIDFEASCLPINGRRSFPIEVGVSEDGVRARSWLIRPHADWADWNWTAEAEQLHGISRERLMREGRSAEEVCAELFAELKGRRVVSDSHLDAEWLAILAKAAGTRPPVKVEHLEALVYRLGSTEGEIADARASLDTEGFGRHRAAEDARWLAAFIGLLQEAAEERRNARAQGWLAPYAIAAE